MFKATKHWPHWPYLYRSQHLFMRLMKDPVKFTLKVKN